MSIDRHDLRPIVLLSREYVYAFDGLYLSQKLLYASYWERGVRALTC